MRDEAKTKEQLIGELVEDLREPASSYESRPPFIIEMAKRRLQTSAKLIGEIVSRRQAEEALRKAHDELEIRVRERTAELEQANRDLQDFAFVAAHDLQEPLRKISIFASLLKINYDDYLDDKGRHYVERIQRCAGRMSDQVRDVLHYSMITSRARPFTPTDLKDPFEQMDGRMEIGELPTVEADPHQMRQLFQHLIENALKFRRDEEDPLIRIHSNPVPDPSSVESRYQILVEDNGVGIKEPYLDRIFTPFEQVHDFSKYKGTGMGLAICRKIVERHGGTITVTSTPGKGSTFIITLPVKQRLTGEQPVTVG